MIYIETNADQVGALLERLNSEIDLRRVELYGQLGLAFQEDVRKRIQSSNEGEWSELSKWVKAKKAPAKALEGAEKFVKFRVTGTGLELYGETGADWTLTQHHEGFVNKEDDIVDGRVTIDIVDPGPLGLAGTSGQFSWMPKNGAGSTPARQIWPDGTQSSAIALPIASRWLEAVVNATLAGGDLGRLS